MLGQVGFTNVAVTQRYDPFRGTSKESTARKYEVSAVNVLAFKS